MGTKPDRPISDVSFLFSNVRSIVNKRESVSSLIETCSADIIVLTETWLSSNISNDEIFECNKGFNIYRCDREDRPGGGVLIAVADRLHSFSFPLACSLEIVCVCVRINHRDMIFCCCYRPPNPCSTFCDALHDVLNNIVTKFPRTPLFLLGDFNFPKINWSTTGPVACDSSSETKSFVKLCTDFNFSQLITEPTRSANTLDLVLTTTPDLVHELSFLPGLSDHCFIHFVLKEKVTRPLTKPKQIRDYSKGNFAAINEELAIFLDEYMPKFDERSVECNWNLFKDKTRNLINKYIPLRIISCKHRSPWFNVSLKRLLNKKKRLFRNAKRTNAHDRWLSYNQATSAYKDAVKKAKLAFYRDTLPTLLTQNVKKFWNVVNGSKRNSVSLTDDDGVAYVASECCNVLNEVFSKSFSQFCCVRLPNFDGSQFPPMDPVHIDWVGVKHIIHGLKLSSSCGVDDINSKFLKNTEVYSSIIISKLFSQSLQTGCIPRDWKVGKVTPLYKSGNRQSPLNYRPISLTSVCCKILEHIIYSQLVNFLETNSFFSSSQHGFRKSYSCETQLISFTHDLFAAIDKRSVIDCIFLDFSKAFDVVSHQLLFLKLSKLNIDHQILTWIKNFLSNRTQFVTANDCNSPFSPVNSGVPQGSVLGPLLFLIYINDLPNVVNSSIKLFADDCVIYRVISNSSDTAMLQTDLDNISAWCTSWHMRLNTNKCKVMRISRSADCSNVYNYHLEGLVLEKVMSYKYLGVHLTANLSWEKHIEYISNNANRMLGYLRRNFYMAPSSLKLLLYKTLVRSKLEYASSVWDPGLDYLSNTLESVQNRSARFILSDYHRNASVSSMKLSLNLPLLYLRRQLSRLSLFQKIYYHNTSLKRELFCTPAYLSSRSDHANKVAVPFARTNLFYHSFLVKTSKEWNDLPSSIATLVYTPAFKTAVENFLVPH